MCGPRLKSLLFGFVFAGMGTVAMIVFGQVSDLHCAYPEPSQLECIKEIKWLGLVPLGEENIDDVQRAWVDESCDSDGCTYRVVLTTGQGDLPLTSYYSSGERSKAETAAEINAFVAQGEGETLEIRAGSGFLGGLFGGIFVVIGLGIAVAGVIRR